MKYLLMEKSAIANRGCVVSFCETAMNKIKVYHIFPVPSRLRCSYTAISHDLLNDTTCTHLSETFPNNRLSNS